MQPFRSNWIRGLRIGSIALLLLLVLALFGSLGRPGSGADSLAFLAGGASARGGAGLGEPSANGASASLAFGAAIRRIHFAWSPEGAGFEGGHSTYGARATASGVAVMPVVHEREGAKVSVVRGAPLVVDTVSIARGGELFRQEAPSGHVEEDGYLSFKRGGSVERLRNTEEGVEQSWVFERRPEGRGDLVVRLRVSGQDYAGETPKGLHFKDPRTKLGVRYGHATWIDARGERTDVRARYVDGNIELRVPELAVAAAAYPAVLDPILGPELGVGVPVIGADAADQALPAIACGPETCLVVWADFRGAWISIRGARVTHAGALLDERGFTLSPLLNAEDNFNIPVVTWGNEGYLVLWNELHAGGYETRGELVSSSVGPSPVLKAGISVPTEKTGTEPRSLAVAFDSAMQSYLIVWDGAMGGAGLGALRMSVTGLVPAFDEPFTITGPNSFAKEPSVACGGAGCLVAWQGIGAQGLDVTAAVISMQDIGAPFTITEGADFVSDVRVASNGTSYLVVWEREPHIFGARINQLGTVDIPETKISEGENSGVAFDSATQLYMVTWKTPSAPGSMDVVGARVTDVAGVLEVLDPVVVFGSEAITFRPSSPQIACADTSCIGVWSSSLPNPFYSLRADILGRVVGVSQSDLLTVGQLALYSLSPNAQRAPAVAFDPDKKRFMIVWQEDPLSPGHFAKIHHTILGPGDADLSDAGALVESADITSEPAIAYGDKSYLLSWVGHETLDNKQVPGVFGKLLTAEGAAEKNTIFFQINFSSGYFGHPAVSSDGFDYLVVWNGINLEENNYNVYATGVSASGKLLQNPNAIIGKLEVSPSGPAVAYDGTSFLVLWDVSNGIRAVRVSTAGGAVKVLDTVPIDIASTKTPYSRAPAVAYDGESYLVVWRDNLTGAPNDDRIYGTRVSRLGVRLDEGFEISRKGEPSDACCPAITFDGSHYLVVWPDTAAGGQSLRGAWVGRDGSVFPTQVDDSSTPVSDGPPALASDGAGRSLLAYSRMFFEDESGERFDVERVRVRSADNACTVPAPPECSLECMPSGTCDECMLPGTCNPETAKCAAPIPRSNGAACANGLCISGTCVAGDPAESSSEAGVGASSGAPPAEGSAGCSCRAAGSRSGIAEGLGALTLLLSTGARRRLRRNPHTRVAERYA
jgi:hypothetical protein